MTAKDFVERVREVLASEDDMTEVILKIDRALEEYDET